MRDDAETIPPGLSWLLRAFVGAGRLPREVIREPLSTLPAVVEQALTRRNAMAVERVARATWCLAVGISPHTLGLVLAGARKASPETARLIREHAPPGLDCSGVRVAKGQLRHRKRAMGAAVRLRLQFVVLTQGRFEYGSREAHRFAANALAEATE
jgi:hypothetical protein